MKRMKFKLGVMGVAVLMAVGLSSLAQAQEIKVAAGAGPAEFFDKIKGPFEKASGLKLTVATQGVVGLFKDLDTGLAEISVGGMSFPDLVDLVVKQGYKIPDKNAYKFRVIGKDLVKVIVNKTNPVKKLSKEQLKDIFSGKVVNWKEVGGKDLEIILVKSTSMPGTQTVFQKQIMEGEAFGKKFKEASTLEDVKKDVIQLPGATGLVTGNLPDASVFAPAIPETGRPITAITKGAPSANVLKLFDFIRGEGQKYLAK
jgi:phosphate transport system substrate-binding protein